VDYRQRFSDAEIAFFSPRGGLRVIGWQVAHWLARKWLIVRHAMCKKRCG